MKSKACNSNSGPICLHDRKSMQTNMPKYENVYIEIYVNGQKSFFSNAF